MEEDASKDQECKSILKMSGKKRLLVKKRRERERERVKKIKDIS